MYFINQNINTLSHISSMRTMFIKCRTSYKCKIKILKITFIKKEKKIKKENEKVANRKLENLGNLGNIIPSFLISKFSILSYS